MGWIWDDRLAEVWAPPGKAGSGVVIGTCGVLTARHVIDAVATGAQTGPVLARVIRRGSPPPAWVPMRIAGEDAAWDLAVLHVDQEAPEAAGWVRPVSGSPVVVTVGGSSERDCESVGFPDEEVQRPGLPDPAGWVRQSEQLLGTLLPMGQAKPAVSLSGTLPREWMPLDAQTAAPDVQSGWRGMSGAGVVLPDGRLAGVAVAAEDRHQQRRLYVVPLASVLAQSARLARALADAAGAPVVAETRFAPMYRRLLYPATLRTDGSPVRFDEVADLGVLGVKPIDLRGEPSYLTYVPRDDDPTLTQQLHEAAAAKRMLLVTGYSGSGKSRSAAHAVCQAYPAHRLLRPLEDQLAALVDLPLADLAPAVVWLDDVEKYQHSALAETLRKLLGAGLVLVGTIRRAQYRALTKVDDSRAEFRNPVGEALSDERLVQQVDWKRDWSQSERDRTADYVTNRLARAAVRKGLSLSVWAVAGPELVKELKYIRADEDDPCRYALVRAVLDWHHTGLTSPIPWSVAVNLVNRAYLDHPASDDDLTDAVNWATRPIGIGGRRGRYSLLTRQQDALTANDYIEDWDGRHQQSPIPDATWRSAIANAPSFDSLWNIGFTAHFEGQTAVEQTAMQTLANAGDTDAMVNLGLLLRDRDPAAAQAWWERAAAAGNTDAMVRLGLLLGDRDPAAAQAWWERAAAAGNTDAMVRPRAAAERPGSGRGAGLVGAGRRRRQHRRHGQSRAAAERPGSGRGAGLVGAGRRRRQHRRHGRPRAAAERPGSGRGAGLVGAGRRRRQHRRHGRPRAAAERPGSGRGAGLVGAGRRRRQHRRQRQPRGAAGRPGFGRRAGQVECLGGAVECHVGVVGPDDYHLDRIGFSPVRDDPEACRIDGKRVLGG